MRMETTASLQATSKRVKQHAKAWREALEEAGLIIQPEDLVLCHVMHRKAQDNRVGFFFKAERWTGEPRNLEPGKCSELSWFHVDSLPANLIPYIRQAIKETLRGATYSEHGWL